MRGQQGLSLSHWSDRAFLNIDHTNLALQGYSHAHPRSGRWLVGFGWGVVVGYHTQLKTYLRARISRDKTKGHATHSYDHTRSVFSFLGNKFP